LQFSVDILPLGIGSVDTQIFADLDPGSQNLADPTDPKHCFTVSSKVGNPQSASSGRISHWWISEVKQSEILNHGRLYTVLGWG